MPTTLRMIVDQLIAPVPGPVGRYTEALARALIETAPTGCEVEGVVSSSLPSEYDRVLDALPGLTGLYKSSLARRELAAAWQFGVTTSPGGGMIHAPSLFAPLRRHDRTLGGEQVVATVHDLLAWKHPRSMTTTSVGWQKAMLKRARKHADAVVVPTHALAEQLAGVADFGDRIRVIGTGPRLGLRIPPAASAIARELGLPSEYLVAEGTLEPRKGIVDLLHALGRPGVPDIPLVVIGPDSYGDVHLASVAEEAGVAPDRVHAIDPTDAGRFAVVVAGATAFVAPSHDEGDGTALIEAFALGTPVIHSDTPAYAEVAADAGLSVAVGGGAAYVDGLAAAVTSVVEGRDLADRLAIAGGDRSNAFSWRDSAERVWQLHADL